MTTLMWSLLIRVLKIKYNPLPTQQLVFDDDKTTTILHSSGLSGGKTYNLVMKAIKLSRLNKFHHGGLLAPSYADFKRDVLPTFEEIFENNNIRRAQKINELNSWYYNGQDHYFRFPWMAPNRKLFVFTGEKSIKGPNLGYCLVNEFTSIKFEILKQMLARVRVDAPFKQRILSGTLEDEFGYFEELLAMLEKTESFVWHKGSTSENTHISKDYINLLKAQYDSQMLEVYLSGEHVKIGSNYFYYAFNKQKNISDQAVYRPDSTIHCGLDFNVSFMAAHFGHKLDNKMYHVFDELVLKNKEGSSTGDLGRAIQAKFPSRWKEIIITCDASGKNRTTKTIETITSDVKVLRAMGFTVRYKNVNPRLRKRQILVNGKFDHKEILINPKCKEMIRDIDKCKQKEDYTKDEGHDHTFSHCSDGLDYVIDYEFNIDIDKNNFKSSME